MHELENAACVWPVHARAWLSGYALEGHVADAGVRCGTRLPSAIGHRMGKIGLLLGEIDLATVRLATGYCWCTGRLLEYAGGSAGTLLMLAMGAL